MKTIAILLGAALVLGARTAPAGVHVGINIGLPPPLVLPAPPPLVVVPGVPVVQYAPSVDADLFFYGGRYYRYYDDAWFAGPAYGGPWVHVVRPPRPLFSVPYRYYHVPPGHFRAGYYGHRHWHGRPYAVGRWHGPRPGWHGHGYGHEFHGRHGHHRD